MRRALLPALILIGAALVIKLNASVIPPPDLTVECSGREGGPHCIEGTVVYFVGGWPRTEMLRPSVDASWTPAPVPVYVQPVSPIASAVPEPGYVWAVGAALALLILLRLIGIETDRGGK